ncbi:hypothetical protein Tco_1528199 [Tanacetum coccineum]
MTIVLEEPTKKPKRARKPKPAKQAKTAKNTALAKKSSTMKTVGVVIRDTTGVSVSKKKAQAKVDRGKGMDLLSDVALLEAAQLKKVLKKSKQDTHMLHASGLSDGVGSQPKVPDELKEKTTGTNVGTGTIPGVLDVPKDQSKSENKSWGDSRDDDDNDDDNNDESDDDSHDDDNDVDSDDDGNNVESNDDHEQADDERTKFDDEEEEKQDDEFVHTPGDYVHTDDETNDESKKFDEEEYEELYGDVNISLKDAEPANKEKGDVEMIVAGQVNVNQEGIEKDVKGLKIVDHSATLLSTIKSEVPNSIKEYLGTSLDDALYKVLKKHDVVIIKEHFVPAENVERLR